MGFTRDRLSRIAQIERWHFWFIGRRLLVDHLLKRFLPPGPRSIADIGCGTGLMAEHLTGKGHKVVGVDFLPDGLRAARQSPLHLPLVQADVTCLPLKENCFDAVVLLDVLEHVDDSAILQGLRKILHPGGIMLVTVPAMPWLWSYRDEAAGHLRRYARRGLLKKLADADFHVEEVRYYQFLLFPVAVLTRLLGRRKPALSELEEKPSFIINALMTNITRLEVYFGCRLHWPWGLSLVAVCSKRV